MKHSKMMCLISIHATFVVTRLRMWARVNYLGTKMKIYVTNSVTTPQG